MFHLDVELEHPIIPKSLPIWRLEIKNTGSIWLLLTLFELLWKKGGETWDSYNWQELFRFWGSVLKMSSAILQRPIRKQTEVVNRCLEAYLCFPLLEWCGWDPSSQNNIRVDMSGCFGLNCILILHFFFFAYPWETPFLKLCMTENYLFLIWFA